MVITKRDNKATNRLVCDAMLKIAKITPQNANIPKTTKKT